MKRSWGQRLRSWLKRYGIVGVQLVVLLLPHLAHAGGLGVTGDGFLSAFREWIPLLLFLAMLCGILLWLASSNDYNQGVLAGSVSLSSRGVIGGGAVAILGMLGFTEGALLS